MFPSRGLYTYPLGGDSFTSQCHFADLLDTAFRSWSKTLSTRTIGMLRQSHGRSRICAESLSERCR